MTRPIRRLQLHRVLVMKVSQSAIFLVSARTLIFIIIRTLFRARVIIIPRFEWREVFLLSLPSEMIMLKIGELLALCRLESKLLWE